MSRRLTSYEMETIVNFNEAEAVAYIFTYDKAWQRRIEKKLGITPYEDNGYGGRSYVVPKKSVRPPVAPRKLSAETRAKLASMAKHMNSLNLSKKSPVTIG
jgi:hypothetical protein